MEGFFMERIQLPLNKVSPCHGLDQQMEAKRSYSVLLDTQAYRKIHLQSANLDQDSHQQEFNNLNHLTETNLTTSLAERFNAEIFRADYKIQNGELIHPSYDIPFTEIVEKGQHFRRQNGSEDCERELAELAGFQKLEKIITDPDFSEEASIIVISPRGKKGSIYQHNFYDVYKKIGAKVEMRRFSSKCSYEAFEIAAAVIDPFSLIDKDPTDANFLASPLVTYKNMKEIEDLLQIDRETMCEEELEKLLAKCATLRSDYINYLSQSPYFSDEKAAGKYHSYIKFADIVAGKDIQYSSISQRQIIIEEIQNPLTMEYVASYLGTQPVRTIASYCGIDKGYETNSYGYQSVAQLGLKLIAREDQFGTLEINCGECGRNYSRNRGKLEEKCRYCSGTKGIVC